MEHQLLLYTLRRLHLAQNFLAKAGGCEDPPAQCTPENRVRLDCETGRCVGL